MKSQSAPLVQTDIVLLGAGHANVQVLQAFGMSAHPGIRLTMIADQLQAPYSGMLPGCIAGDYSVDDIHIDIARLTRFVGARLIHARAEGLDVVNQRVLLHNRAPVAYDLLAINVGIIPDMAALAGAQDHAVPVKPIAGILDRLERAETAVRHFPRAARLTVIGGGPAGIELALALGERNRRLSRHGVEITLIAGGGLAPSLNKGARQRIANALAAAGIQVVEGDRAIALEAGMVLCQSGRRIMTDVPFVSTHARLPGWLIQSDLPKADNGGIALRKTLQVKGHDAIFAAGDCATMEDDPRPRAGVFAVRQGPVLARNLLAAAQHGKLGHYKPQTGYLSILRTGPGMAIASRGGFFVVEGKWVWRWKDRIDKAFMAMFKVGDRKPEPGDALMRCGGCAAKVGPDALAKALARLPLSLKAKDILIGVEASDDAAVIAWSKGKPLVTSVDQFRSMVSDPYLFGQIAANHALNDIYAMGGTPHHALALAVLPYNTASKTSEDLFQLLSGARATLDAANTPLVGGHSSEGETMALGFAVTGRPGKRILHKSGSQAGDRLILTKALGTGIVFAADMRAMAQATTVEQMLASMLISNQKASLILMQAGTRAMTDVSGFGLAGHLREMLAPTRQKSGNRTGGMGAILDWGRIPVSKGVLDLAEKGFASSLLPDNIVPAEGQLQDGNIGRARTAILFDPQTAGGLLAAVPPAAAAECVKALREAGYRDAADIGETTQTQGIRLT
jgi:selenide, water dikinase